MPTNKEINELKSQEAIDNSSPLRRSTRIAKGSPARTIVTRRSSQNSEDSNDAALAPIRRTRRSSLSHETQRPSTPIKKTETQELPQRTRSRLSLSDRAVSTESLNKPSSQPQPRGVRTRRSSNTSVTIISEEHDTDVESVSSTSTLDKEEKRATRRSVRPNPMPAEKDGLEVIPELNRSQEIAETNNTINEKIENQKKMDEELFEEPMEIDESDMMNIEKQILEHSSSSINKTFDVHEAATQANPLVINDVENKEIESNAGNKETHELNTSFKGTSENNTTDHLRKSISNDNIPTGSTESPTKDDKLDENSPSSKRAYSPAMKSPKKYFLRNNLKLNEDTETAANSKPNNQNLQSPGADDVSLNLQLSPDNISKESPPKNSTELNTSTGSDKENNSEMNIVTTLKVNLRKSVEMEHLIEDKFPIKERPSRCSTPSLRSNTSHDKQSNNAGNLSKSLSLAIEMEVGATLNSSTNNLNDSPNDSKRELNQSQGEDDESTKQIRETMTDKINVSSKDEINDKPSPPDDKDANKEESKSIDGNADEDDEKLDETVSLSENVNNIYNDTAVIDIVMDTDDLPESKIDEQPKDGEQEEEIEDDKQENDEETAPADDRAVKEGEANDSFDKIEISTMKNDENGSLKDSSSADLPLSKDKDVEDVSMLKDKSVLADVSMAKDVSVLKEKSMLEDVSISKDVSMAKDDTTSKDVTISKNVSMEKDKSMMKDVSMSENVSMSKDKSILKDDSLSKDDSVTMNVSMTKAVSRSKDGSMSKDVSISKDDSISKNDTKRTMSLSTPRKKENVLINVEEKVSAEPMNVDSKIEAMLDKLIATKTSDTSEDDDDESMNKCEFIDSMAEEVEEGDEDNDDSENVIIDVGESIHSSESRSTESEPEANDDSFIVDDEVIELLSGEESFLGLEKEKTHETKKRRKSRIIKPVDSSSSDEAEENNKEEPLLEKFEASFKDVTPDEIGANVSVKESTVAAVTKSNETIGSPRPLSISIPMGNESTPLPSSICTPLQKKKITPIALSKSATPKVIIVENVKVDDINDTELKKKIKDVLTLKPRLSTLIGEQTSPNFSNTSGRTANDESICSRSMHNTSLTVQQTVPIEEIEQFGDQIKGVLSTYCATVKSENGDGNVSINLSIDYEPKTTDVAVTSSAKEKLGSSLKQAETAEREPSPGKKLVEELPAISSGLSPQKIVNEEQQSTVTSTTDFDVSICKLLAVSETSSAPYVFSKEKLSYTCDTTDYNVTIVRGLSPSKMNAKIYNQFVQFGNYFKEESAAGGQDIVVASPIKERQLREKSKKRKSEESVEDALEAVSGILTRTKTKHLPKEDTKISYFPKDLLAVFDIGSASDVVLSNGNTGSYGFTVVDDGKSNVVTLTSSNSPWKRSQAINLKPSMSNKPIKAMKRRSFDAEPEVLQNDFKTRTLYDETHVKRAKRNRADSTAKKHKK